MLFLFLCFVSVECRLRRVSLLSVVMASSVMSVSDLMENPIAYIRLFKSDWAEFCNGKLFEQECNVKISFELFGLLIEIAAEVASNRNKAIKNMLSQLSSDIDASVDISGLVKIQL